MRTFLIILVMVTLTNMAKAADSIELETLSTATVEEMKQYNECVKEQGPDNACINEVFGDIYN